LLEQKVAIILGYFILSKNHDEPPKLAQLVKIHPIWSPCLATLVSPFKLNQFTALLTIKTTGRAADSCAIYHIVIFHFLFRNNYNGLLNPDPPLYFGNGSSPSISQSGFSILIRLYFVPFNNALDVNKVS